MEKKSTSKKTTSKNKTNLKARKTSRPKTEQEDRPLRSLTPEIIEASSSEIRGKTKRRGETGSETSLVPSSALDPVARYMMEIRKYPLLTKEEEHELAVRYHETGDREAAQKLVTSNLRFVVKIAMEYSKFGAKMIDLIQEGNMGLMQAVKEFNPYKGVRLITYAVWWIRGHIQEFLMRHYSMVRIGTTHNQRKLFYELQRSRAQLERMGMEAGIMQISGRLGIPEEEVKEMSERVLQRDVSLDKPSDFNERTTLLDSTSNATDTNAEDEIGRRQEIELLNRHLDKIRPELNERENFILDHRLLADEPLTLQQIGDQYGITREAARQLEAKLIGKIKKQMTASSTNDSDIGDT